MSGAEAIAGLALGVLPLLVAAAEHYDQCFRPFIRYQSISKEADRFRCQLGIQKTIFRNQCRLLLEEIVEHDAANNMLNVVDHNSWGDPDLAAQVAQLLGDSNDACITAVEMIEQRLRDIEGETQELWSILDEDRHDTTDPAKRKAWRHRVAKKLRFSFSKPRLDQVLSDLRSLNKDFKTLSNQTLTSAPAQRERRIEAPRKTTLEVEKYKVIGQASCQVYEALGKACTKHTEHHAHFCVEVEQATINDNHGAQVRFNMAFTHLSLAGSPDESDLIWFVVDSVTGDAMAVGKSGAPSDIKGELTHSLKRQIRPSPTATPKKPKKSVRFQSNRMEPTCIPDLPAVTLPDAVLSDDIMRRDFCDFLRRRLGQPLQTSACVGVLENTDSCKHSVYSPAITPYQQRRQAISLRQLIASLMKEGTMSSVLLHERVHLAKTLAIAVLQYHSTPWLRMTWRSEDVYFFGTSQLASAQQPQTLASPHLNVKVKGPDGQLSRASTFPPHTLARNPLLFSLGVILLEIAYTSTMSGLQRPIDFENGRENRYTEFFAARRLAKSYHSEMGGTYHKIVERLIECDFGCGNDLNSPQLQMAFHDDVICPLERLEKRLRELHFDT